MNSALETAKPKYLIDERGRKKAVVITVKEYEHIIEMLEDLDDANDLLRAEREAAAFTPYEKFRTKWLKN